MFENWDINWTEIIDPGWVEGIIIGIVAGVILIIISALVHWIHRLIIQKRITVSRELIPQYYEWVRSQPEVKVGVLGSNYSIEPSDFLEIVLQEVKFDFSNPRRPIRKSGSAVPFETLFSQIKDKPLASKVTIIFGEAGVGKTTFCKHIRKRLTEGKVGKPTFYKHIWNLGSYLFPFPPQVQQPSIPTLIPS